MRKYFLLLLAVAGCSKPKPKPEPPVLYQKPSALVVGTIPKPHTDTSFTYDTVKVSGKDSTGGVVTYYTATTGTEDRRITKLMVIIDSTKSPALPSMTSGISWGPFAGWIGDHLNPKIVGLANMGYGVDSSGSILRRIDSIRAIHARMTIIPTGGARRNYLTNGVFDPAKWYARLKTFDTPAIKAGVTQAYNEGLIDGASVMDEPFNCGTVIVGNSWGPCGTMTRARVDSLCMLARPIFPGVPIGFFADHSLPKSDTTKYKVCDFQSSQWRYSKGTMVGYRDAALKMFKTTGVIPSFGINLLDGGKPASGGQSGPWDCPVPETGGRGETPPNCRMTPDQIRQSIILAKVSCMFTGFKYAEDMWTDTLYRKAFKELNDSLAKYPRISCKRPDHG